MWIAEEIEDASGKRMPLSSQAGTSITDRTLSVRLSVCQGAEVGVLRFGVLHESHIKASHQAVTLQDNCPRTATTRNRAQRRWHLRILKFLELWGAAACLAGANLPDDAHARR
jgi:hypothetical protein